MYWCIDINTYLYIYINTMIQYTIMNYKSASTFISFINDLYVIANNLL